MSNQVTLDAFPPLEMAERMEDVGVKKANLDLWSMFSLAVLAGAFIGLGAEFYTIVVTDSGLGYGMMKLVGGAVFSLGLILVVIAGAELFTGNNLIVMAWVSGKLTLGQLVRNWIVVYAGNLVGSLATALLLFLTRQWTFANYGVGVTALNIANGKVNLSFTEGVARGILCNALVCLAVWLCLSGRSVTDKILAILFPITAFVASGFEHSIANMYFIPMGLLLRGEPEVIAVAGKVAADLVNLNFAGFLANLLAVTTGNIFGGGFMVAAVYWFIYRRPHGRRYNARQFFELFVPTPARENQSELRSTGAQGMRPEADHLPVGGGNGRPNGGNGAGSINRQVGPVAAPHGDLER